ncbi:MAG: leucine-rich repeat domain-containing protein [Anaerolineae bacterium]|nr:leucine-rich repeat domain-containing protein [Anaerolineae bacterium]
MNQQELRQLIAQAAAEEWTELDLHDQELTKLPPEIGQLINLTSLNLNGNELAVLPPEIGQLSNLTSLRLGNNISNWLFGAGKRGNILTILPPEIGRLTSLSEIDLSGNKLTVLPPEIGQLTRLSSLNLNGNELTAIPLEIGQLTNLKELYLSLNQLVTMPSEIGQMTNLTEIYLSGNQLTSLPPEIGQLGSLTSLDLRVNQLTSLPPEIGQLTNLTLLHLDWYKLVTIPATFEQLAIPTSLDLSGKGLTCVPQGINHLSNLTSLNLSNNNLTAVPSEIGQLTKLTSLSLDWHKLQVIPLTFKQLAIPTALNLSGKGLTAVPQGISHLTSLTSLNLSGNNLTAVPPEIGQLTNLTNLDLSKNQLSAVPPEIGQLTNLNELNLRSNKLINVPPEIGQLANLTSLDISQNTLTAVPPEIGQLTNLTKLKLWGNNLTAVSPEIGQMNSLTTLYLSYNQLSVLPPEIGQLNSLTLLNLERNQLTRLPDSLHQLTQLEVLDLRANLALGISLEVLEEVKNPALILRTYFGERQPLHEAKLLLVGQGGVGKTALARRLLHNLPPDEDQGKTPGVDIHKWAFPQAESDPITLNLWDFGGQGVYQATHQFFFTSRSLYLVVINARTGEQESRLRHWLKLVASLSDNAPVIVVVNKQDEHTLALDERELKHKYPNLLHVIATSCTSGAGIDQLRQAIADTLPQLPGINDSFPTAWFGLKAQLEAMDANYITYERYAEYCLEAGIDSPADQRSWVQVLHHLGVVLNYQDDNYRQLEGTHVLKPEWVTDGVYRILSDPDGKIAANNGILTATMLDHILDPVVYPHHQQVFIVEMMRKFELSFRIPHRSEQYLIPDLLPKEQPPEAGFFESLQLLHFQIHYTDFLPSSILSRFMVGMMAALDRKVSWRNGAVLKFDGNMALVRADLEARKLFITINGTEATRRGLLNSIRMQLHAIHNTFPNLPLTEHIPIPGQPDKTIAYHALCNLEAKGIDRYYDPVNDVELDVNALLAGIETPTLRRERQLQESLLAAYNLEGLMQLCFELAVEYDDLPGQTKSAKTRELVLFMGRNGRLDELEAQLRERPGRSF